MVSALCTTYSTGELSDATLKTNVNMLFVGCVIESMKGKSESTKYIGMLVGRFGQRWPRWLLESSVFS